jgi:uncharacterized GH25 family protein
MPIRRVLFLTTSMLIVATLALAHDLFLKLDSYFVQPHARVRVTVINGTFTKSEGYVMPDRLADVSLVAGTRTRLRAADVWSRGPDSTSVVSLALGDAGTYVVGVSVRPRELQLAADDFNAYLKEDGLPDILEARRAANELGKGARERYSKHVKAVFQVGDTRTLDYAFVFGYPAEIVPLGNPYAPSGTSLRVRCLVDGKPVANQVVLWGGAGAERETRTDAEGVAEVTLDARGRWYVKFVHMERANRSELAGLDYESKWATLTFETR